VGQQLFACHIQPRNAHAARRRAIAHTIADAPARHDGNSREKYGHTNCDGYTTAYRYTSID
jgi:hypothetical protein